MEDFVAIPVDPLLGNTPVISMIFTVLRYVKNSPTFVKILPVLTN